MRSERNDGCGENVMSNGAEWPKISIVTVSFNHGEFIRQNIESVLQQNYPNFEHIIIDGGSTDDTLDILRSYPHLKWTSESDRGQSDALNKGFSRITGEITGWLNSDDWYAPDIFFDVAKSLKDHQFVLGAGQETDREGKPRQLVPNVKRDFFDVLKYWCPYAWLAQPSVFFRTELLERVRRADGKYLDDDLFFCMDFDLWARMAAVVPFDRRIDRILSYYRIYDTNKTGRHPVATQRECGRVFRRYSYTLSNTEHRFSFVIPAASITPQITDTLTSIAAQNFKDFEIVFVDYAGDKDFTKQLRDLVLEMASAFNHNSVRFVKAEAPNLYTALNDGIFAACALIVCTLQEGDTVGPDFLLEANEIFVPDSLGFALPLAWKPELKALLFSHEHSQVGVKIGNIFKLPYIFPNFVARKVTMMELGGLQHTQIPPLTIRDLLARVCHKSWGVSVNNSLSLAPVKRDYADEQEYLKAFDPCINAKIMLDLTRELQTSPFAAVRLANGVTFAIPDALRIKAEAILKASPPDWHTLSFLSDREQLQETSVKYPEFAPAWYFIARASERKGDAAAAQAAWERFRATAAAFPAFT